MTRPYGKPYTAPSRRTVPNDPVIVEKKLVDGRWVWPKDTPDSRKRRSERSPKKEAP